MPAGYSLNSETESEVKFITQKEGIRLTNVLKILPSQIDNCFYIKGKQNHAFLTTLPSTWLEFWL